MQAIDLLRSQITFGKQFTESLLADMLDAPMTFPTANGGNHPTWVAGHLAHSEANLVQHMLLGGTNPLLDWNSLFGGGSEPTADAASYPSLPELLAKWTEVRESTEKLLSSLSDADLDKPIANCPPGREDFLGTYGKILSLVALHPFMHRGQVADSRRMLGREKLTA